jgi:hypothetical protein
MDPPSNCRHCLTACGKAALTPEMALRIEKGPDMNHLLRMQLAYDVAKTREHARDILIKRYVRPESMGKVRGGGSHRIFRVRKRQVQGLLNHCSIDCCDAKDS